MQIFRSSLRGSGDGYLIRNSFHLQASTAAMRNFPLKIKCILIDSLRLVIISSLDERGGARLFHLQVQIFIA